MYHYLLVGIGGGLGAIARAGLGGLILHHSVNWRFPIGTFVVNVVGCLVGGVLAGLIARLDLFSPDARVFLFTGVLGGFTTFSAFSLETITLMRRGEYDVAMSYVLLSVVVGIALLGLAMTVIVRWPCA